MGLFDFWMSEDQKIASHQRTLTDKNQQAEDREKSARWLVDNGGPKGIVALLTRFDMALENQLKDSGEKDFVYGLLAGLGDAVMRPLDRHLEKCRHVAHPLRLYVERKGEAAAVERVFQVLELERAKDDFKPEKKMDLLVWLAGHRHPGAVEVAARFLEDFDEGVRYAASEVIIGQGEGVGREPLLAVLTNPQEESNRLRIRIAGVFASRRWDVPDGTPMPAGFSVQAGRVVAA
jgi:hypothetical protein